MMRKHARFNDVELQDGEKKLDAELRRLKNVAASQDLQVNRHH